MILQNVLNTLFWILFPVFFSFLNKNLLCVLWLNWYLDTSAIFRKGKFKGERDGFFWGATNLLLLNSLSAL